jgi:poly(3-hydroxybutyrate) depolymerase
MRASALILAIACAAQLTARQPFFDRTHVSKVLGETRHYRILLPPGYETSGKHYPVIYYFHGHSDRYTLEHYDNGADTIPKMANWVSKHDAIVVAIDGYVAGAYTGFYGGSPWDVLEQGGDYDFGAYFVELVGDIGPEHGRLYEPVPERALSGPHRQRVVVQPGAGVLYRR